MLNNSKQTSAKIESIETLANLRLKGRDDAFARSLTELMHAQSALGLLNSGSTLRKSHQLLVAEFQNSRVTIVEAVYEWGVAKRISIEIPDAIELALKLQKRRQQDLEFIFSSRLSTVLAGLQNKLLTKDSLNLSAVTGLQEIQLAIDVRTKLYDLRDKRGATLVDRWKNHIADHPLGAAVLIAFVALAAVGEAISFFRN